MNKDILDIIILNTEICKVVASLDQAHSEFVDHFQIWQTKDVKELRRHYLDALIEASNEIDTTLERFKDD